MARYIPQRQTIIDRTVKYMKELGTYKVQYKQVIEIYADMIYQYNVLSKQFEESKRTMRRLNSRKKRNLHLHYYWKNGRGSKWTYPILTVRISIRLFDMRRKS